MPTQITQNESEGLVSFRVEGEMLLDDALLLERLVAGDETDRSIVIDMADLDFLDSEAAQVLRRLETERGVKLVGTEIFLQSSIDLAERIAG
ncbi:MAG: STAS domain-containing protein [Pyrinomonadaceae bacterium]